MPTSSILETQKITDEKIAINLLKALEKSRKSKKEIKVYTNIIELDKEGIKEFFKDS